MGLRGRDGRGNMKVKKEVLDEFIKKAVEEARRRGEKFPVLKPQSYSEGSKGGSSVIKQLAFEKYIVYPIFQAEVFPGDEQSPENWYIKEGIDIPSKVFGVTRPLVERDKKWWRRMWRRIKRWLRRYFWYCLAVIGFLLTLWGLWKMRG